MKEPLVTIFTAVYNHEKYLEDYFKSIISQTYNNIELVIIDDCSTDNSVIIIEKWMDKLKSRFNRVVFISRNVNKGLVYNCNEAIQIAKGDYICLFASDDIMAPHNIEYKVEYLEKNKNIALVYSDGFFIDENATYGNLDKHIISKFSKKQKLYEGEVFQKLIDFGCFIPAPTVLLRREIVLKLGGYSSEYMFEDYQMWLKIAKEYKVGLVNKPLVYYRLSTNSLSRSVDNFKKMINDHERLLNDIKAEDNTVDISIGLQKLYKDNAKSFFNYNLKQEFLYYYNKIKEKDLSLKLMYIIINFSYIYRGIKKGWSIYKKFRAKFIR
ncbi:glycosyltransferase [Geobacillus stearothermophilus]|uniref:glycosyltransferase n=1 Tax=Anoxybacillaceae TaxID=3120669 RepID=UPI000EF57795|nr:glycosyltransferase [Geobacillus stearothermophilus]RLP97559.1 glycosyltransferase [Geobacillus stearothermophilus]